LQPELNILVNNRRRIANKREYNWWGEGIYKFMYAPLTSQAARVQGILRTLAPRHGITIGELADEFGVKKRSVYRDLKALEETRYSLFRNH
jgi:hypothetical protein